jgi:two-component system copper resistance phosphate regulon response regulator CusR
VNRILLVEDESSVVEFIKKGLSESGHEVTVAFDGESAIKLINDSSFDLYILDIMLPGKNGIEVCRELRKSGVKSPVLFLSALGTSENIALGLNEGADDYLIKPFKFIELNARVNALLRRYSGSEFKQTSTDHLFTAADLVVDDDAKVVKRGETEINLTATEYRLLLVLLRNKNRVLSRNDLLESAWDIGFNLGTNVVDVYINYLRKKLDTPFELKLIHTVVGMGYVLKDK